MKRKITACYIWAFLGIVGSMLAGCEKNSGADPGDQGGFKFVVQLPDAIEVETKSGLGVDLITVQNMWIVQYNSETGALVSCVYLDTGFEDVHSGFMMQVKTDEKQFSVVSSRFYMIVNAGQALLDGFKDALGKNTEADLKKKTVAMTNPLMGSAPLLLSSEAVSYTPEEGKEKVIVISRLYRAYAKISLSINVTDASATDPSCPSFTLDNGGVTLTNLPDSMAVLGVAGESGNYPHKDSIKATSYILNDVLIGGTKKSFWMAENLRGTGTSTSFSGKNKETNGPNGTLKGCTYLTLKGTYKYHDADPAGIKVEYRFYLGSNLTKDYNIRRDHHYDLTINLKGANSADMRVTITDGNVAVFDEVDQVTNEVIF